MSYGPDLSDSDDSYLSDDGDYYEFKKNTKIARNNFTHESVNHVLSEQEKTEQLRKSLYSSLCSRDQESVIRILENGIDINVSLQDDWSPLTLAVSFGQYDITQELLKRGARINTVRNGMTALMMACSCPEESSPFEESYKIAKILVENGANVKSINRKRMTALMFAANTGNLNIVKYLLPLSSKDAVDNQRWTALFWAVNGNCKKVVEYLLEKGLDYRLTDVRGNNPLELARTNNCTEILSLFTEDETESISNLLSCYSTEYEEINSLEDGKRPQFFLDIYDILNGVRCESAAKTLSEKKITLFQFLSSSYMDLKNWGVQLPYQRERIMGGIHKIHKYPYHPNSLHVIPLDAPFSNLDALIQILSMIKQIIAMEASLHYIRENYNCSDLGEDKTSVLKNLHNIRHKLNLCRETNAKLLRKIKHWDNHTKPVDHIDKNSALYRPPWRKLLFVSILSTITIMIYYKRV